MNDEIGVLEQLMQRYLGAVDLEAFNQNITKEFHSVQYRQSSDYSEW